MSNQATEQIAILIFGISITVLLIEAPGCKPEGSPAQEPGASSSPCSTGAPYEDVLPFPIETDTRGRNYPACTPRCGSTELDSIAALPSGNCTSEGESCSANSVKVRCSCGNASYVGAVHQMRCDCKNAQWHCVITYAGSGGCLPCDIDGGGDARAFGRQ